ncbi:MAG: hypothetical protein EB108_07350, partial [Actinobacteria bacterium]|nr:hypothetical protein [Actinomycetota bacterium]
MNNLAKCGSVGTSLGEFGDLLFEAFGVCLVENFGANRVRGDGGDQQNERRNCGRAYVASFNFKGSDQQKRVGDLSGGERNRVHLAKLLKNAGNVL